MAFSFFHLMARSVSWYDRGAWGHMTSQSDAYLEPVGRLLSMGFPEDRAISAIQTAAGDLTRAVDLLLTEPNVDDQAAASASFDLIARLGHEHAKDDDPTPYSDDEAVVAASMGPTGELPGPHYPVGFVLIMEVGTGNIVEQVYEHGHHAQLAAARLWCSWVMYHLAADSSRLCEVSWGGLGFSHDRIRRHALAKHQASGGPDASVSTGEGSAASAAGVTYLGPESGQVMQGVLEKKPVSGVIQRGVGIGWRVRRIVLLPQSMEWHHGEEDSTDLHVLVFHPTITRVRAGGDAGDDVERCLSVSGIVDSAVATLVLRAPSEEVRDLVPVGVHTCKRMHTHACTHGHACIHRCATCGSDRCARASRS